MYNYTLKCQPEDVTIRELTLSQCAELQTACIRLGIEHFIEEIRPTMLAPDKGQAAVVKDNLGSAPCG